MAQFLQKPPLKVPVVVNNELSVHYKKYLNNLNGSIQSVIKPMTYTSGSMAATGHLMQFPSYSTIEINTIQNPEDGAMVYDTTTQKFKFREGGAWVEK